MEVVEEVVGAERLLRLLDGIAYLYVVLNLSLLQHIAGQGKLCGGVLGLVLVLQELVVVLGEEGDVLLRQVGRDLHGQLVQEPLLLRLSLDYNRQLEGLGEIQVVVDSAGQLAELNLLLPHNILQFWVAIDNLSVVRILESVALHVLPQSPHDLDSSLLLHANQFLQLRAQPVPLRLVLRVQLQLHVHLLLPIALELPLDPQTVVGAAVGRGLLPFDGGELAPRELDLHLLEQVEHALLRVALLHQLLLSLREEQLPRQHALPPRLLRLVGQLQLQVSLQLLLILDHIFFDGEQLVADEVVDLLLHVLHLLVEHGFVREHPLDLLGNLQRVKVLPCLPKVQLPVLFLLLKEVDHFLLVHLLALGHAGSLLFLRNDVRLVHVRKLSFLSLLQSTRLLLLLRTRLLLLWNVRLLVLFDHFG